MTKRNHWKLFFSTLLKRPKLFPLSIILAVYGFHFRKVAEKLSDTQIEDTPASG